MPNSIPFDHPSLVLGNSVDTQVLEILRKISSANSSIEAAQVKMNSLVTMKRSIAMTINELLDLNIDVSELKKSLAQLDAKISASASSYLNARLSNESTIQSLREELVKIELPETLESPVDFAKSELTKQPLSVDSLKLDAQYFNFEQNNEQDSLSNIESFIKDSTADLGAKSGEISKNATSQIIHQKQHHDVSGTLIITASCSHKNVGLFEPCIISPEKAVRVWNHTFPNDKINTQKLDEVDTQSSNQASSSQANSLTVITGASYGSSFVGMVHFLNSEKSSMNPSDEMMDKLTEKLQLGGWLGKMTGGLGVDESVLKDVQKLLSSQEVSSHITMLSLGAVPSIASNKIKMGVNRLNRGIKPVAEKSDQNSTAASEANSSIENQQAISIENLRSSSMLSSLQKIDERQNSMLDINTLLSSFENYVTEIKSAEGIVGVPTEFHLRKLTREEIIELWKANYQLKLTSYSSLTSEKPVTDDEN